MESVRNGICKEWILQGNRLTSKVYTSLNCWHHQLIYNV